MFFEVDGIFTSWDNGGVPLYGCNDWRFTAI